MELTNENVDYVILGISLLSAVTAYTVFRVQDYFYRKTPERNSEFFKQEKSLVDYLYQKD